MSTTTKLMRRFETACKRADSHNARVKSKRFHPLTNTSNNRVVEVGMYDAKTKKYAISDIRHYRLEDIISEIENMLL
jgi:hypothetical protein